MVDVAQLGAAMAAGATAGSVLPGVGTALGAAGGVALSLAPEIGQWLFGPTAERTVQAVQSALTTVTGTPDSDAQLTALSTPETAAKLRIALASIAAQAAQAAQANNLAKLTASINDVQDARSATLKLVQANSPMAWGAAVVSVVVLFTFFAAMIGTMTHDISNNAAPVLNVLLGSLTAMATSVVSYWVGSSVGSFRKDTNAFSQQAKNK